MDGRLPDGCKFYSSLKDKCTNDKDFLHAVNVWNTFEMNTIGGYHDLYLKTNVLLSGIVHLIRTQNFTKN